MATEATAVEEQRKENFKKLRGTYLRLRANVGKLALALPVTVWLGDLILRQGVIQPSISAYYHTEMRNWFVGSLFAIGFFLLTYNPGLVDDGYKDEPDHIYGVLAGLMAMVVAITPTGRPSYEDGNLPPVIYSEELLNNIHLISVSIFFVILVIFSAKLFRKGNKPFSEKKKQRNKIYLWCGVAMAVCVAVMALYGASRYFAPNTFELLSTKNIIFWTEFAAIMAFGFSWSVKGEALQQLNDED